MSNKSLHNDNSSYNPFNFLKLDNRLNVNKKQLKKKQQQQKHTLSIYQKKLPNQQLINQCNKIMNLYKDHYNNNRVYNVFLEPQNNSNYHNQQSFKDKNNNQQLPSIKIQKSLSTHNFASRSSSSLTKSTILDAQKIMKPLKTNQYLNKQGFIKIHQKAKLSELKIFKSMKKVDSLQLTKNGFTQSAKIRIKSFYNILSLTKSQNQYEKQHFPNTSTKLLRNPSFIKFQRKKNLKIKFRKNIFIILQKLKLMKISLSEIIDKDLFDKKTPYKFGEQIFHAIKEGNQPKTFRITMQNRLSIFGIDTTGKTTLMWASIRGHDQIVELLLSNGVDLHWRDINGKTALEFGIKYNHLKCVKIMFIYSHYIESYIESVPMSQQMRKMVRIGLSTHNFLNTLKNLQKKKQYFEQQYRYYFKQ